MIDLPLEYPVFLFVRNCSPRKSKSMCWRDIIFTTDDMILPASQGPAYIPKTVRLARARCISEEERVLLDSLM